MTSYVVFILSSWMTLLSPLGAQAAPSCAQTHLQEVPSAGMQFIHQRNQTLHTSKPIEIIAARKAKQTGAKQLQKPAEKISTWLNYLEHVSARASKNSAVLQRLKNVYHNLYVTRVQDISEGYYNLQVRIAREQGRGDIALDAAARQRLADVVIKDQKKSLDEWVEYLVSPDSASYPMWAKFWCFNSLVKLAKWNPETGVFGSRDKGQIAPFPELNREALALVMDMIVKRVNGDSLADIKNPALMESLQTANFGKLYGKILLELSSQNSVAKSVEGIWITYKKGEDHMPLVNSLKGKNTGWCTAGENTAQQQLSKGDFHVYYSLDSNQNPTVPRVAIRTENDAITEVRGVAENQNLDPQIAGSSVVSEKLESFGSQGTVYKRKNRHMVWLTEIDKKTQSGKELTKEEIKFLYEIDREIVGFGYKKDPRIEEILNKRNQRSDLAFLFDAREDQISFNKEELARGDIVAHIGDLKFDNSSIEGLELPRILFGTLKLSHLKSIEGLILPRQIKGSLGLESLELAEGLTLPQKITGYLNLSNLQSTKGVKLPDEVGELNLGSLKSAGELVLPREVKGTLDLRSLESAKGVKLPVEVGYLILNSLNSAEGVVLPRKIGFLEMEKVQTAKGLIFPREMSGLALGSLQTTEGLILPQKIGAFLTLMSLRSAEGLILPLEIRGLLNLRSLQSAKGLKFPEEVGDLNVDGLKSTEGVVLPRTTY